MIFTSYQADKISKKSPCPNICQITRVFKPVRAVSQLDGKLRNVYKSSIIHVPDQLPIPHKRYCNGNQEVMNILMRVWNMHMILWCFGWLWKLYQFLVIAARLWGNP